jgi:hypothetical protein
MTAVSGADAPIAVHPGGLRIGETDCEALGGGLFAQPVNASTSLSYVAVGLVVLAVGWRRRGRPDLPTTVFAMLLVAVGLGSVAFHGPQWSGAQAMHDAPILLLLLFVLGHDVALLRPRVRRPWLVFATAAAVTVSTVSPDAGAVLTAAAVIAIAVAELLVDRRHLRHSAGGAPRRLHALILVIVVIAGASWFLGRTGSPACDPDGLLQFHGLWHAVSSVVFGAWWWLAIGSQPHTGAQSEE